MPSLNLLVIRVSDIERSRPWYEDLGFSFAREQHGSGPVHYAAEQQGFVLELYPASAKNPVSAGVRLGFMVSAFDAVVSAKASAGQVIADPAVHDGVRRAVLVDPDGIKVEVVEAAY